MFARLKTLAFCGVTAELINVEVHLSSGLPGIIIVGLANKAVMEAKERVKSALLMLGISLPSKKITVNLSPANIYKEGNHYDLSIAIAILCAMGHIKQDVLSKMIFMGELALNGQINKVSGILLASYFVMQNNLTLVCPMQNVNEAQMIKNTSIVSKESLQKLTDALTGKAIFLKHGHAKQKPFNLNIKDFADVKGQKHAKRALELASIGGHNVLMVGPGSGKSMLAERITSILPELSEEEMIELNIIHSISGTDTTIGRQKPFRAPHHSSSLVSLVGGGKLIKPGEVSLAHNGILFLDELAEFPSFVLESLRVPMELGVVNIARAEGRVSFPCNFQLIAATNPCKCGYLGDAKKECHKVPLCGANYFNKLSGPLMERIDMNIPVNPAFERGAFIKDETQEEPSSVIKKRVMEVRRFIAEERMQKDFLNTKIPAANLEELCHITSKAKDVINAASSKFHLSLRQCHKIIRLARTVADANFKYEVCAPEMLEAINFKNIN